MKFAKDPLSGTKIQSTPKALGICFCCDREMVAKCGDIKIHHWAHKSLQDCDHWWENETEWHRGWKDRFPIEWQEIVKRDFETGEKHIADIYSPFKELVIEFQNSPIKGPEIQSREKFYKRMLWLLNGAELSFSIMPVDELNEDFARLASRIKASFLKPIRVEKVQVEGQIGLIKKELQIIDEELTKKKITDIEWLRRSNEIDKRVAALREDLEYKKNAAEKMAKNELQFVSQYSAENLKRGYEDRFVLYDWKYKNPSWNDANSPIFVDFENELFLLKTKYVAVAVPVTSFLGKYGPAIS